MVKNMTLKKILKQVFCVGLAVFCISLCACTPEPRPKPLPGIDDEDEVGTTPDNPNGALLTTAHPRLIWNKGEEKALMRNINSDVRWKRLHEAILSETESVLTLGMQDFTPNARGEFHSKACEEVRRVLFLAYCYRTTGEQKYLTKCKEIIAHVCGLASWNPNHFLDIAELTFAMSFAYDWLYDALTLDERAAIITSIRDKALLISETGTPGASAEQKDYELRWMDMESNWNQVCHGSLAIGAAAIYESEPEIAERIIKRSKEKIMIPMQGEYPPMGAYPEGIGYWGYGTALNAIFINVMENCFGLTSMSEIRAVQGFMQTGQYYSQLITNTLNTFAFSDNSTSLLLPEQCIFWFYAQTTDPTLLYYQAKLVDKFTDPATDYKNDGKPYSKQLVTGSYARHLPLMMVWGAGTSGTVTANLDLGTQPSSLYYIAEGKNPICVMRSGWETTDWWVGFKAGNPSCPHGHMDVGCFLFEYGGARFAVDLGSDSYNKVSSHISTSLFDMTENSARWHSLLRYNNRSHNTLTINNKFQKLETKSDFIENSSDEMKQSAVANLTPSYEDLVKTFKRGVALMEKKYLVVEDYIEATSSVDADVVWNMTTKATFGGYDASTGIITLKGKNSASKTYTIKLKVVVDTPTAITVECTPVSDHLQSFETAAANHYFLRIKYKVPKGTSQRMKCYFLPDGVSTSTTTANLVK